MDQLKDFVRSLENQDCSPKTSSGYLHDLKKMAAWFENTNGEPCRLEAITPSDIRSYREFLLKKENRKAATINRFLAAMAAWAKWGMKQGLIDQDPSRDVRSVPQVNQGPKYLDKKDQYALQRAIEKDLQLARLRYPKRWISRLRDGAFTNFLMNTGLRLQEALDLRWGDVQLSERKGRVIVRKGKGSKQRSIPLNSDARKVIQDWMNIRPQVNNDFVWVAVESEEEGALSSRSMQRAIYRLGQQAGLENLTPHMLRHTFAKNLVDSGVGLEKVAALLGHSNLNTTRVYITPSQQDLEQAVEQVTQSS